MLVQKYGQKRLHKFINAYKPKIAPSRSEATILFPIDENKDIICSKSDQLISLSQKWPNMA